MTSTISGAAMFGKTCRTMTRPWEAPSARDDSTNGNPITSSTAPRTTRANAGAITMPIAIIAFRRFGPSSPAITIASTSPGSANMRSTKRIRTLSSQPPKKPASRPSVTPSTKAMLTEITPTCSDTWAPWMMRASVSRPSSSVPIGWAQLGG